MEEISPRQIIKTFKAAAVGTTKKSKTIFFEFERTCIIEGFNKSDQENIKEIASKTPRTISSVANTYALHNKNKEDTLKAIEYSMGC